MAQTERAGRTTCEDMGDKMRARSLTERRRSASHGIGRRDIRDPFLPGGTRLGDYQIEQLIGAGATSLVYRARQLTTGVTVAIKVPRPAARTGFVNAVMRMKVLDHPAFVSQFHVDVYSEQPHVAMEFCSMGNLRDQLVREPRGLPLGRVLVIAIEVLKGLDFSHGLGLVHRNLKPTNILFNQHKMALIGDFGLGMMSTNHFSPQWSHLNDSTAVTSAIEAMSYIAPEQSTEASSVVDHLTDLFSFGRILVSMLTGRQTASGHPSQLRPELDPVWDDLVHWLTQKRRSDRPQSARAVLDAIGTLTVRSNRSATHLDACMGPDRDTAPMRAQPESRPTETGWVRAQF